VNLIVGLPLVLVASFGLAAPAASASPASPQDSFVLSVQPVVGKNTKGWQQRQQVLSRGEAICRGLKETGYSAQSISYQARELTPMGWNPRFPLKRNQASRVVAGAIKHLCPIPPSPPPLQLTDGWVRDSRPSISGPFSESYTYSQSMTYGMTIPIGNLAQVPSQQARIVQINCTGEWYARRSFRVELVDPAGNVLATNRSAGDSNRISPCSISEIADIQAHPSATAIRIPSPSQILTGSEVSAPGVSVTAYFSGIAPAEFCAEMGNTSPRFCRTGVGEVYFPTTD